jgi:hypothetical protein
MAGTVRSRLVEEGFKAHKSFAKTENLPRAHRLSGPRVMPPELTPVSPRLGRDAGDAQPREPIHRTYDEALKSSGSNQGF